MDSSGLVLSCLASSRHSSNHQRYHLITCVAFFTFTSTVHHVKATTQPLSVHSMDKSAWSYSAASTDIRLRTLLRSLTWLD